jgi:excisionase family DNA binding protein
MAKDGHMEKLLTVRQLQDRLQVDRMTIYRMLSSGRLSGVKVGGQWRFREEDVNNVVSPHIDAGSEHPGAEPRLPLPCLEAMQQLFAEATGVAAVIVDAEGQTLTEFSNTCGFCNMILASETGRQRCARSWASLADGFDGAPRLHRCHAGMMYARTFIHVDSKPLAAAIAGQVLSDADPAEAQPERLAELAEACAIPLSHLQEAYPRIPRLDHAQLDRMLHLLKILGVAACRIGSERQRLVTKLDRIAQITMET